MARPFHSAYAAAQAYAGQHGTRVQNWNAYTDQLRRQGIIVPAPPSRPARKAGAQAVRAEQWRGHRWVLTQRRDH